MGMPTKGRDPSGTSHVLAFVLAFALESQADHNPACCVAEDDERRERVEPLPRFEAVKGD